MRQDAFWFVRDESQQVPRAVTGCLQTGVAVHAERRFFFFFCAGNVSYLSG